MAVKTLAVKYRPTSWDEVSEQSSTKIILQQQLKSGEVKNAYLFCGPAGCGKTTCARIFANDINKGEGNPIELDAASNNGVDDVRNIIQQAKTKSINSEYKIFIIDECFPANTLIDTEYGQVPINKICVGDYVKSMTGNHKVTHIFKNSVLTDRLCCVIVNNKKIITTVDHLFFTEIGWVEARNLKKGLIVYGSEDLQELWNRVCKEAGQRREILLSQLLSGVSEEKSYSKDKGSEVSDLWQEYDSSELLKAENLFSGVQEQTNFFVQYTNCEYRIWDGVTETIIRKNEDEQSNVKTRKYSKDVERQGAKWYVTSMAYSSGWKREVYNSTDSLVASIRRWMGIGVSNSNKLSEGRTSVSYMLQSRPWFFDEETCDRSRWSRPSLEKWTVERCKENEVPGRLRVDSVEIYERGNNDELFRDSFTDTELSGETVTMYDLEVDTDHSYFADGVLVHNCHALSNSAWQAMLKIIEEPPAKSIFIFCTTDPQKIPKTILSRVQRYDFQRISQTGIFDRLSRILDLEEWFDDSNAYNEAVDAIDYIARLSDGGMRDAITMLDKCLAYHPKLTLKHVTEALGTADYSTMFEMTDCLLGYDGMGSKEAIEIIEALHAKGKELKTFIKQYVQFLLDLDKYSLGCDWKYLQMPKLKDYETALESYGEDEWDDIHRWLSVFVKLNADIKWSQSVKYDIEATIIVNKENK